jgi:hypothetical protein
MTTLVITGLFHDLGKKRSHVTVVWEEDSEKRLGFRFHSDARSIN